MSTPHPSRPHYAFGRFRLTADATLLLDGDVRVRLAPKVLQTLLVLVERAGQVVTKDELMAQVWPGVFVEETGLPFRRWILWRRLMRSVERMATGETLTSAALRAGFSDSAHFSRTFLRMFGVQASALGLV